MRVSKVAVNFVLILSGTFSQLFLSTPVTAGASDIKVVVRICLTRICDWNVKMFQNPDLMVLHKHGENPK